jgi:hypothetical protein
LGRNEEWFLYGSRALCLSTLPLPMLGFTFRTRNKNRMLWICVEQPLQLLVKALIFRWCSNSKKRYIKML